MDATAKRDWSALDVCYQLPKRSNFPVNCTVELRHPGLPDNGASNILFRFPAYDSNGGGLCHSIALTACAIVTGNKFTGYLSSTATGPPVAEALDAVLTGPFYYFHPHPKQPGKRNLSQPYLRVANTSVATQSETSQAHCRLVPAPSCRPTLSTQPSQIGLSLATTFHGGGLLSLGAAFKPPRAPSMLLAAKFIACFLMTR